MTELRSRKLLVVALYMIQHEQGHVIHYRELLLRVEAAFGFYFCILKQGHVIHYGELLIRVKAALGFYCVYLRFLGNIPCNYYKCIFAGGKFRPEGFRERIRKLLLVAIRRSWEEDPPQKAFKPRCKNLTVFESYAAKDLGEEYWAKKGQEAVCS